MISVFQAAVLGAVQGLAEFLPISSSAHLRIVPWLLGWQNPAEMPPQFAQAFDVSLHAGTLIAVLVYFFWDWLMIIATYIGDLRQKRWLGTRKGSLLPKLVVATVPAAILGKLLEERIEGAFYERTDFMWILGVNLAVFGVLLWWAEHKGRKELQLADLTWTMAMGIGLAQAAALVPGVSRSGITIVAALLIGFTRGEAARFSFLLGTPIIAGATLLKVTSLLHAGSEARLPILVGIATSALIGLLAIHFLIKWVTNRGYGIFAVYRLVLAAVVIGVYLYRAGVFAPVTMTAGF